MKWLKSNKPYFYLIPALFFVVLFLGYGLFRAGMESVNGSGSLLVHYFHLVKSEEVIDTLKTSLYVTVASTFFSLLIGLIITRFLYRIFTTVKWKYIVWIPMIIPHFVAAYLMYTLFSQTGFLATVLYHVNESSLAVPLVNDAGYIGVILTYIWKEVPFVVLMLLPVYQQLDKRYEDVVRTLGGSRWKVWKTVELPWIGPVLLETGLIIFAFVIAAYEVPALLGVTYPKMFAVLVYEWFYEGNWEQRPFAQAFMISLTIVMVISSLVILRISKRWQKQWVKEGER